MTTNNEPTKPLESSELEFGKGFGEQQIRYIPTVNIYADSERTKLWNGEFRTKP